MSVAVFGTDRLRFASPGTRTVTLTFSHPNSARSNTQIQAALRARQTGAGIITVTDHTTANTVTVTVTMPADARRPADGSTDLWEWNDGVRTYRSGPLAWRWDSERDPAVIDVDIAFGFGARTFPAHTYRPGWGLGLGGDLTEAITGYRVSRLNPLREAKIVRGRSHELAAPQPARAVIVLDDTNGHADPDNADAPAPYRTGGTNTLTAGLPIRMLATAPGGVNEQIIFTGIIERIRQDYPGHTDERVVLECVDAYKLLGQGSVDATQPAVTSLDAAYQAVAADGGLPAVKSGAAPYTVTPAVVTRVGTAVAIESYTAEAGTTTASELRNFERATASQLRISRDGSVEALMPSNFLELPGSYVDVGDGSAELRYSGVEFARDDDRIINRVQVGSVSLVPDSGDAVSASQAAYGVRLLRVAESPLAPSLQVIWGIGVIRRWAQPVTRLQQMTLKPREVPALWPHVLAVDVAEAWRVTRTSPVGKTRVVPLLTERVEHHVTATDWTTKLQGTSVNPLADTITTFTLTPGGREYCVGVGEDLYLHRVFTADTEVAAIGSAQVQIIAIAGGGGGGYTAFDGNSGGYGGGGGAGGVLFTGVVDVASGDTLTATVGAGGRARGAGGDSVAAVGGDSFTAVGGGDGADGRGSGGDGGSGGGGGTATSTFGRGTPGQGHDGGDPTSRAVPNTTLTTRTAGSGGGAGGTPTGVELNLAGETLEYARGGGGGQYQTGSTTATYAARAGATEATAGSGGGGGASSKTDSVVYDPPRAGRDGLVVVRWRKDLADLNPADLLPPPTQAPPTPTGLTATAATSSTVNASANTAARAASYQFRWREGNGSWTTVNAGGSPSATISGLGASTTYQIQVRARNSAGDSAWSSSVSVTTPAQTNPPATPAGLTVTAAGPSRLDAVCDTATGASGYRWRHRTGTGAWTTATTTSPARAITGLAASTTYEVQVQATNSAGSSDWTAGVSATTAAAPTVLPDAAAPTVAIATITNGTQGTTVGLSVTVSGGTYDQLAYAWAVTGGDASLSGAATATPTLTRRSDTGNMTVTLTVTATGTGTVAADGTSDTATDTETATATAAAVTPSAVRDLAVTAGNAQFTATFTEPADGDPNRYRLRYRIKGSGDDFTTGTHAASPITITGLTNGTVYELQVRAEDTTLPSGSRFGPWSTVVDVTPSAAPDSPQAFVLAEDGSTMLLLEDGSRLELEDSIAAAGFALLGEAGSSLLAENGARLLLEGAPT